MTGPEKLATSRRTALTSGGVGAAGLALAACGDGDDRGDGGAAPSSGSAAPGGATTLAAADVPVGGGTIVAGAKVVVTQPTAGEFKAFSAVCTHQGCVVSAVTETIDCACHDSHFALADGAVVSGPATAPLPATSVTVDGDTLTIS